MFAGILRAPITSVFMILEVSGSYSIVLPVMISNMVAYVVSRQYQRDSIFDVVARQDGMELPSMEHRREAVIRRVEDAMRRPPLVLPREVEVRDALRLASESADPEILAHVRPTPGSWRRSRTSRPSPGREGASRHRRRSGDRRAAPHRPPGRAARFGSCDYRRPPPAAGRPSRGPVAAGGCAGAGGHPARVPAGPGLDWRTGPGVTPRLS
jgi:hypothetical protein